VFSAFHIDSSVNLFLCYRNIIIYLFHQKDQNATLSKQEILETAVKHLKKEFTEREYHQVWNKVTSIVILHYVPQQAVCCIIFCYDGIQHKLHIIFFVLRRYVSQ
jgi:predicted metal-dependent peptidase